MTDPGSAPVVSGRASSSLPLSALRSAIERAKGGDPLAPVTVAVPSNYAGLSLRRRLGFGEHWLAGTPGEGLVNVRFMVFSRVAEFLGAPGLAARGLQPLTPVVLGELVRRVLEAKPDSFAPVMDHPSTLRALVQTFRELRRSPPEAVAALAPDGRVGHLGALFLRFRSLAARGHYDEADLAEAAAAAVARGDAALRDIGHVVLYLVPELTLQEQALADALTRRGMLTHLPFAPADPDWSGTQIWAAPDPEEEVRTALRLALQRVEAGAPAHRIAVLYPTAAPYALLIDQVFGAARMPFNGPATETLRHSVTGRFLLAVLRLAGKKFHREDVMGWLTACPVRDPDHGASRAPAQRWEVLVRRASVVQGADQWRVRLAEHQRRLAGDLEAARHDGRSEATLLAITADQEYTRRLLAFIEALAQDLVVPQPGTWTQRARHARGLIDRYLFIDPSDPGWTERHYRSHEKVLGVVDELAALPGDAPVPEAVFLNALEQQLEAPAGRTGSFGVGVFAGRYRDALGTAFDSVLLLGMNEGLVPARGSDDPLLPDGLRPEGMPRRMPAAGEEREAFLAALGAGGSRVLLFSLADPRTQHTRLPSRYLLEAATALTGRAVTSEDLVEHRDRSWPWFSVIPSFEGGLQPGVLPLGSQHERDLWSLREARRAGRHDQHYLWHLGAGGPDGAEADWRRVERGLEAQRQRFGRRFTAWDGLVEAPGPVLDPQRPLSPTSLQNWAACPRRYLFANLLRVEATEDPADSIGITALERGSLIHRALERFVKQAAARRAPTDPWTVEERETLLAITEAECDEAERRGVTGKPLMWALGRAQILRDVEGFLEADERLRREYGVVTPPDGLELRFGDEHPVSVELAPGITVSFHGAVDRMDVSPDGRRVVVLDYKTGSDFSYAGLRQGTTTTDGGKLLQLPVYGLAAQHRHPGARVEAYYWFVTERGEYQRLGYPLDDARIAQFKGAVAAIVEGVNRGLFPANPGRPGNNGPVNCTFCPYDRCCPADRSAVWKRKRGDDRLAGYRALEGGA